MLLVELLTTFSKTVSYNTGPGEVNSSPNLIPVESTTSKQAFQQRSILTNNISDQPDQQDISEEGVMSYINPADQNTNVHQMTLNSYQSGM